MLSNAFLHRHSLWIRITLHWALLLPLVVSVFAIISSAWGGDPVQQLIHFYANWALNILVLCLVLAPLSRRFKRPALIAYRRLVGLYVAFYAFLHILAYLVLDLGLDWALAFEELVKRPYILVGALAFLILLALTLSSPQLVRRKMKRSWLKLHGFIYALSLLLPLHFWWSLKSGYIEPLVYLLILLGLVGLRTRQFKAWIGSFRS
ncbi:sulfoxide reductase heme-binding subunit YedZ [Alginatibacterium sediminis]|uniref:Protein-methionine-sulfoxide reductase heme-binding subunit MsrQ n=1 Tax=Alginatibacterium sediminis TaxID=2164068 RepID=A0A420E8W2_9ALTE|nr:protein-methionine-sulfoxide reductase heme-binding subunit MsrQ [Alginatibacterium sediminis]RKF15773.1 sulfoxide reductase heme-binding subunit YedZ [Alginatibacterium sediminis]